MDMAVRSLEDLTEFEKLALVDMSYSRISTYDMCNLQYFYSYVLKEPSVFGAAATLGNIIHEVLEEHVGDELDLDEILKSYYGSAREKYDPEEQIPQQLINEGKTMLVNYVDLHKDSIPDVYGKERYFQFVLGSAFVRGYIDRVDTIDNHTIKVTDYKSGKHKITIKGTPTNVQLCVYVLAMAYEMPEIDTFIAEIYYLRDNTTRSHTFTRDDIPTVQEVVTNAIEQVLSDVHHHPTQKTFVCSFCDHAKSGICSIGVNRNKNRN